MIAIKLLNCQHTYFGLSNPDIANKLFREWRVQIKVENVASVMRNLHNQVSAWLLHEDPKKYADGVLPAA